MVIRKPCKNTLYLNFNCPYLKNELGDPNFLSHKSNQQAKIKLSAKFKRILWSRFRAILNFQLFKVALNLLHRIFFNFAESFITACRLHFRNKKMLEPKYGVFLQGFPVATVTFYVTKMTKSFSAIMGV